MLAFIFPVFLPYSVSDSRNSPSPLRAISVHTLPEDRFLARDISSHLVCFLFFPRLRFLFEARDQLGKPALRRFSNEDSWNFLSLHETSYGNTPGLGGIQK